MIGLADISLTKVVGGDSVNFTLNFEDNDGDLGFDNGDTLPPYNVGSIYYNDVYVDYYEYDGSRYRRVKPPLSGFDTIQFAYRLPRLNEFSKPRKITGQIKLGLILQSNTIYSNKVRFSVFCFDKALHKSNIVFSKDLIR